MATLDYLLNSITPLNPAPASNPNIQLDASGNIIKSPTPAPFGIIETPAVKSVPVVSADKAKTAVATKQNDLNNWQTGIANQQVVNSAAKATAAAAKVTAEQAAKDQALKQSETDAKNKINETLNQVKDESTNNLYVDPATGRVQQGKSGVFTMTLDEYNNQKAQPPTPAGGGMNDAQAQKMQSYTLTHPNATQDEIDKFIANGYSEVTRETPGEIATGTTLEDLNKKLDEENTSFQTSTQQFINGTFPLNPTEQAEINDLQNTFNNLIEKQKLYNKNYEGGMTILQGMSGRSKYAPELAIGNIQQAVSDGLTKVADLEAKARKATSDLNIAFQNKDYAMIEKLHADITKSLQDKEKTIQDTNKSVREESDRLLKAQQDELNMNKTKQEMAMKSLDEAMPVIAPNIAESDFEVYAKAYGLDENVVRGKVQAFKTKQKQDQDKLDLAAQNKIISQDSTMIGRGYRTISPADADRLRQEGQDVQILNGRAYAKPQKLTSKTYKGVVSWYNEKGELVKTEKQSGTNPTPKPIPLTKEEQAFQKTLQASQKLLATKGPDAWGQAWDTVKNQYPDISNEQLDQMLNKDKYYPK